MKNLSLTFCLAIAALFGSVGSVFSSELPNCPGSPVHVLSKIHEKWHNCEGELRYLGYLVSKRFDLGLFVNREFTKPKWCHKNG